MATGDSPVSPRNQEWLLCLLPLFVVVVVVVVLGRVCAHVLGSLRATCPGAAISRVRP